jgi:hypothetical protein
VWLRDRIAGSGSIGPSSRACGSWLQSQSPGLEVLPSRYGQVAHGQAAAAGRSVPSGVRGLGNSPRYRRSSLLA